MVPMMKNPLWFLIALGIGSVVTGVIYAALKRPLDEQVEKEEEELDFDLDINIQ